MSVINYCRDKSIVKFFLENQADVNLADEHGNTPLIRTIFYENRDIVELLLEYKAIVYYVEKGGFTPLIAAIDRNDQVIARILLDNGADLNFVGASGVTLRYTAAIKINTEIIKILVAYGVNSDIETCTLPYNAIRSGHGDIVHLLLHKNYFEDASRGEDVIDISNLAKPSTAYELSLTPLHLATKTGHPARLITLLNINAYSNQIDEYGRTPLHYAVEMNRIDIIDVLLKFKGDVNIKDKNGLTAPN